MAEKLGIDLIWFGVLLASTCRPRSCTRPWLCPVLPARVAPTVEYLDKVTKKMVSPSPPLQIYWGAVPFVLIQIIMVTLVIVFPGHRLQRPGQEGGLRPGQGAPRNGSRHARPRRVHCPQPHGGHAGADPVAGTASAAEGAEPASDSDDPLKALQDSLAEEPKQN